MARLFTTASLYTSRYNPDTRRGACEPSCDRRLLRPSRTPARPVVVVAAIPRGRGDHDLPATADPAAFHARTGGGLGHVGPPPVPGAAHQRRAVFGKGAAAVLVDPCGLGCVRRQRRVAARADGADWRRATRPRAIAGAAAVSRTRLGRAHHAMAVARAVVRHFVRPADHVRRPAGCLGAWRDVVPGSRPAPHRAA